MVAVWTRVRLSQWGRWCRGRMPTGYPTASAFVHANEGQRGDGGCEMPSTIGEVDRAIAELRQELRQAIFAGYVWSGPFGERARRLRWPRSTLSRRLARAESHVERNLSERRL